MDENCQDACRRKMWNAAGGCENAWSKNRELEAAYGLPSDGNKFGVIKRLRALPVRAERGYRLRYPLCVLLDWSDRRNAAAG